MRAFHQRRWRLFVNLTRPGWEKVYGCVVQTTHGAIIRPPPASGYELVRRVLALTVNLSAPVPKDYKGWFAVRWRRILTVSSWSGCLVPRRDRISSGRGWDWLWFYWWGGTARRKGE